MSQPSHRSEVLLPCAQRHPRSRCAVDEGVPPEDGRGKVMHAPRSHGHVADAGAERGQAELAPPDGDPGIEM